MHLKMRIAPELYLKQLVIGGFHKVYEIGKVFRNEGMDHTHNPEFTSCEFYQAYSDYEDLMKLTEEFFQFMALSVTGSTIVDYNDIQIDFSQPFQKISFVQELKNILGFDILTTALGPGGGDDVLLGTLKDACLSYQIVLDTSKISFHYLVDKLASHLIESKCIHPTFFYDYPIELSPLAKQSSKNGQICERFELFIAGKEFCNAYSELNDPREQRRRFSYQQEDKEKTGNSEAHELDENYCEALEYGLPPCGGWGIGIDRLVMLLTNQSHLRDVLLFPLMKDDIIQSQ